MLYLGKTNYVVVLSFAQLIFDIIMRVIIMCVFVYDHDKFDASKKSKKVCGFYNLLLHSFVRIHQLFAYYTFQSADMKLTSSFFSSSSQACISV